VRIVLDDEKDRIAVLYVLAVVRHAVDREVAAAPSTTATE